MNRLNFLKPSYLTPDATCCSGSSNPPSTPSDAAPKPESDRVFYGVTKLPRDIQESGVLFRLMTRRPTRRRGLSTGTKRRECIVAERGDISASWYSTQFGFCTVRVIAFLSSTGKRIQRDCWYRSVDSLVSLPVLDLFLHSPAINKERAIKSDFGAMGMKNKVHWRKRWDSNPR